MADVPTVTIVNGLPTAGSGTVQTISTTNAILGEVQASPTANTLADRLKTVGTLLTTQAGYLDGIETKLDTVAANIVTATVPVGAGTAAAAARVTLASDGPGVAALGAPADAKVVTDANGSIAAYLRGLVTFAANALGAGTAAAASRTTLASDDPAVVVLGAKTDAKSTATDATSVSQMQVLKQISASVQAFSAAGTAGYSAIGTFTPAAASHVANDCNGAAATFTAMGPASSRIIITTATLEIDGATAEASAWRLYLYNVTPPSAYADDTAWDLLTGDRASFLGFIDLGTAVDLGGTQWIELSNINKELLLAASGNLFGYLVNLTTLTPANVAHIVTLHSVAP